MSGHSKWANIKNKKAKGDAARGKIFTKLGRELAVAVKAGGSDPSSNRKLYDVIQKCKAANMPNDNITRGIKKAAGELNTINYEEVVYEGYGPGGSAVIVNALTDNKNRTASDVRHYFDKFGGSLGLPNSVLFMFDRKGVIVIERTAKLDEDTVIEYCLESGGDDVAVGEDVYEVFTSPDAFSEVCKFFEGKGVEFLSAEVSLMPQNEVELDEAKLATFGRLYDALDDLDDVQTVSHNVSNYGDDEEE